MIRIKWSIVLLAEEKSNKACTNTLLLFKEGRKSLTTLRKVDVSWTISILRFVVMVV